MTGVNNSIYRELTATNYRRYRLLYELATNEYRSAGELAQAIDASRVTMTRHMTSFHADFGIEVLKGVSMTEAEKGQEPIYSVRSWGFIDKVMFAQWFEQQPAPKGAEQFHPTAN